MKASILTIGDEILIGQIIDTNSAWLATELNLIGIEVNEIRSVSDSIEAISKSIDDLFKEADIIITTGGIGPTRDDITKNALVSYFDDHLVFNEKLFDKLQELYRKRGKKLTEAHRNMCHLPSKSILLENLLGSAPGIVLNRGGNTLISLPGVPYEMKDIVKTGVIPLLRKKTNRSLHILHRTILTAGEGETKLNRLFEDIELSLPPHFKIAFLPGICSVRIRLTGIAKGKNSLELEMADLQQKILERIRFSVFGFDKETLEEKVGQLCLEKGYTLATAESCTAGRIATKITSVAGSSAYFTGGIIVYSNEWKKDLLRVPEETLEQYGAVSKKTVLSMLNGLLEYYNTDMGIAVTGIAGPGGGSEAKPVGTVWIACGNKKECSVEKLQLTGNRHYNIEYSSVYALNMLRKILTER